MPAQPASWPGGAAGGGSIQGAAWPEDLSAGWLLRTPAHIAGKHVAGIEDIDTSTDEDNNDMHAWLADARMMCFLQLHPTERRQPLPRFWKALSAWMPAPLRQVA